MRDVHYKGLLFREKAGKYYLSQGYPCNYREHETLHTAYEEFLHRAEFQVQESIALLKAGAGVPVGRPAELIESLSVERVDLVREFTVALAKRHGCDPFTAFLRAGLPGFVCNGVRVQLTVRGKFRASDPRRKTWAEFDTPQEAVADFLA